MGRVSRVDGGEHSSAGGAHQGPHASPCKGKKCKGSYSFVFPALHNRTVGNLLLDPQASRLLVAFREDTPQALEFARRLGHPIECDSVNSKPFLMVEADPVDEADEICETVTEFLMAASQTLA